MRRLAVDMTRWAAGGALALPVVRRLHRRRQGGPSRRILVFYYHRVYTTDVQPVYQLGIARDLFRLQLVDLARRYRFVPLLEALEAARTGAPGEDLACLTFDDGYRDNHDVAWPVFRELGLPATIFLVAGLIGTRRLLWFDEVKRVAEGAPGPQLRLPASAGGGVLELGDPASRRRALGHILDALKECDDARRRRAVEELTTASDVAPSSFPEDRDFLLSWEEARAMEEAGVRFGSHTLSHPLLSRITDPRALDRELRESREILEAKLRAPLPVLAYPGGAWSEAVLSASRDAGYTWGLANAPGPVGPDTDPFLVPRRGIGPRSSLIGQGRHSRAVLRAESEGFFDRARGRSAPRRALDGVAAAFDEKADAYARARREDPAFAGEERWILSFLPERSGNDLLIEIGSGAGITAGRLCESGWKVVATDVSFEMLRRIRLREEAAAAGRAGAPSLLGLVRCDAQRLPFRDARAAALVCHGVLEYLPDVPRALGDMARVLAPGGALVATSPNRMAPSSWASSALRQAADLRARLRGRRLIRVVGRHRFPRQVDALARQAGLTRADGVLQTFTPVPPYLFPRAWLRWNNRVVESLPRSHVFRWWGTQYIALYLRRK